MKTSRRQFARILAAGVAAPLVPEAAAQRPQTDQTPVAPAVVDAHMKDLASITMNDARQKAVQESIEQTIRQIDKLRAYKLKRSVEPAISHGMLWGVEPKGGRRAG